MFYWIILLLKNYADCKGLREEFTWTKINYTLPKEKSFLNGSDYIYGSVIFLIFQFLIKSFIENNVPMGANIWKDKLFVTVPRRKHGIPSTLNYISLHKSKNKYNVPLIPYPDYLTNILETNQERHYNFISVYRVNVDSCDRLWFVDTGIINVLGKKQKPIQLIYFICFFFHRH